RVVFAAGQQGLVDRGELRVEPQRRNDGVGHRDRTHVAGLGGPDAGLGRAHHVPARPVVGPRRGVQSVLDRDPHQLVVGRVVFDLVDAVAIAVVGAQDGPVALGQLAPALGLPGAGNGADRGHLVQAPLTAFADQRLDKDRGRCRVVLLQERDLVDDGMSIWHATNVTFFLQPHKRCNAQRGWPAKNSHSLAVAKSGQWWPPSPTVTSTTPRWSGQPAVDVVTESLVVSAGSWH